MMYEVINKNCSVIGIVVAYEWHGDYAEIEGVLPHYHPKEVAGVKYLVLHKSNLKETE